MKAWVNSQAFLHGFRHSTRWRVGIWGIQNDGEVVTVAVDWLAIRNDYINGGGSYRKLAEKYGVSFAVLKDKAVDGKWTEAREQQANKIRTKAEQKAQKKISDALSDEAAAKARIGAKVIRMVENWIDKNAENAEDTGDIRRIVQSCVDMGIFDSKTDGGKDKKNNLLDAIQNTEEIDTDDLPEVE